MIIFYITYALAIMIALIDPNVIVIHGGVGASDVSLSDICLMYLVFGGYWWLSKHKDHPIIGPIYNTINFILVALFIFFALGYAKKSIKEWWDKD